MEMTIRKQKHARKEDESQWQIKLLVQTASAMSVRMPARKVRMVIDLIEARVLQKQLQS